MSLSDYIACALWSSLRDDKDEPLDTFGPTGDGLDRLTRQAKKQLASDYNDFIGQAEVQEALAAAFDAHSYSQDQAAHDFWLTRNGHGAGFWDRGLGELGETLTKLAKAHGSADLYVSKGWIYHG